MTIEHVKCPNCEAMDWLVEVKGWKRAVVTRDAELGTDTAPVEDAPVEDARIETDYSETYVKCRACRVELSLEELDDAAVYTGEEN